MIFSSLFEQSRVSSLRFRREQTGLQSGDDALRDRRRADQPGDGSGQGARSRRSPGVTDAVTLRVATVEGLAEGPESGAQQDDVLQQELARDSRKGREAPQRRLPH